MKEISKGITFMVAVVLIILAGIVFWSSYVISINDFAGFVFITLAILLFDTVTGRK